jgi:hypothetical protein
MSSSSIIKTTIIILLSIFFFIAGVSKFINVFDKIFLSHQFMVDVYDKLTYEWNDLLSLSLDSIILRKFIGGLELIIGICIFIPSLQLISIFIGLLIMIFASASHFLLEDPLVAYIVPLVAGLSCSYIISLLLSQKSNSSVYKNQ